MRLQSFSLFLLAIMLASCTGQQTTTQDLNKGTEGIAVSFLPSSLKEIIVSQGSNEPLTFFIEVKNKGTYPKQGTPEGSIWLSGFDPSVISLESEKPSLIPLGQGTLEGRSPTNPIGTSATHEFIATIQGNALPEGKYKPTLLANVCYRYQTSANPLVCVEKDPFSQNTQNKACKTQDITLSSQGAPLAITKIEPMSSSEKIQFKITIKNVGTGIVADPQLSCNPSSSQGSIRTVQRHQLDIVKIESVKMGDNLLACNANEAKVRLIDGIGYFTCTIEKSQLAQEQAAFATPLDITLSYLYKDSTQQPLTITKITT